jgi:hypothetical protein
MVLVLMPTADPGTEAGGNGANSATPFPHLAIAELIGSSILLLHGKPSETKSLAWALQCYRFEHKR